MKFLSFDQVVKIHDSLIREFGGSLGIRSKELLDSAINRMQASFDGEDLYPTIFEKASSLLQSLVKNHPFVDGNKRTTLESVDVFFKINDFEANLDQEEIEDVVLKVAQSQLKFEEIAQFLKKNYKKI